MRLGVGVDLKCGWFGLCFGRCGVGCDRRRHRHRHHNRRRRLTRDLDDAAVEVELLRVGVLF